LSECPERNLLKCLQRLKTIFSH